MVLDFRRGYVGLGSSGASPGFPSCAFGSGWLPRGLGTIWAPRSRALTSLDRRCPEASCGGRDTRTRQVDGGGRGGEVGGLRRASPCCLDRLDAVPREVNRGGSARVGQATMAGRDGAGPRDAIGGSPRRRRRAPGRRIRGVLTLQHRTAASDGSKTCFLRYLSRACASASAHCAW